MGHEVKHVLYTYFPKKLRVWGGEGTLYLGNMVCSTHGICQKCIQNFIKFHGRKLPVPSTSRGVWTGFNQLRAESNCIFCEQSNEPTGYIKDNVMVYGMTYNIPRTWLHGVSQ
jgi:hypothetical protein